MSTLAWILASTIVVSLISFVGALLLFLKEGMLKKIILPMVAFSAGALLSGAFLHLLPEAIEQMGLGSDIFVWVIIGFALFFVFEQFIHWHHSHEVESECKHPVSYLVLVADGLHNFIDGLAVAGAMVVDVRLGLVALLATAAHEIPQELGDFAILLHSGWKKSKALLFNFISALFMVLGGLVVYFASFKINVDWLLPFAAGNFIYIAAADLIPEVKHNDKIKDNIIHLIAFLAGVLLLWGARFIE